VKSPFLPWTETILGVTASDIDLTNATGTAESVALGVRCVWRH
jgi:hypothetical protein